MGITFSDRWCPPDSTAVLASPVGNWWLEWSSQGLTAACITKARPFGEVPSWLRRGWDAFWNGDVVSLTLCGGGQVTPFARRIYEGLCRLVPRPGQSISLVELAQRVGTDRLRAVRNALASNPWPLFVPSHRVVENKVSEWRQRLFSYELPDWWAGVHKMADGVRIGLTDVLERWRTKK